MIIRDIAIVGMIAAMVVAGGGRDAWPQTASSNSGAQSGSNAAAGSQSGSFAGSQIISNSTPTKKLETVPQVYAPPVAGGTNPCVVGASGGGSILGFGLAVGGTWNDKECARRNASVVLFQQGHVGAAKEVMCGDDEVYAAMARAGTPCVQRVAAVSGPVPSQPVAPPPPSPPPQVFYPEQYTNRADCLTAASARGVPLGNCSGIRP